MSDSEIIFWMSDSEFNTMIQSVKSKPTFFWEYNMGRKYITRFARSEFWIRYRSFKTNLFSDKSKAE
jgi:hypothetical protein